MPARLANLPLANMAGTDSPPFRFLDLPAEVRVTVYRETLSGSTFRFSHDAMEEKNERGRHGDDGRIPPLLQVCQSIRAEATTTYCDILSVKLEDGWECYTHLIPYQVKLCRFM
jgi:hypothetical protein